MWKYPYIFETLKCQNLPEIWVFTAGRKKTSLKHRHLHGIVTCPYLLGLENGVCFLRRFSFRCGIGCIFVVVLSSLPSEHFCCDLVQVNAWGIFKPPLPLTSILDDRRIRLSFAFAGHTVCNVCLQHFPYIVTGTSVHTEKFIVQPLLAFQSCFGVIDVPFVFRRHFALWTRTLKYVPKQSIPLNFEHERYHRFGHVLKYAAKQSITWHFTRTVSNPLAKHHSHYRNKSNRHTTPVKTENAYHIWLHLYCLYYKKSL